MWDIEKEIRLFKDQTRRNKQIHDKVFNPNLDVEKAIEKLQNKIHDLPPILRSANGNGNSDAESSLGSIYNFVGNRRGSCMPLGEGKDKAKTEIIGISKGDLLVKKKQE